MAFGLSGSESFTLMDGADVTVSWVDNAEGPIAQDYHLRSQERVQVSTVIDRVSRAIITVMILKCCLQHMTEIRYQITFPDDS